MSADCCKRADPREGRDERVGVVGAKLRIRHTSQADAAQTYAHLGALTRARESCLPTDAKLSYQ